MGIEAAAYVLWFRPAGIQEQIFDTNDLSTIRGSSAALLGAPEFAKGVLHQQAGVRCETVFSGASQALFWLEGERDAIQKAVGILEDTLASLGLDPAAVKSAAKEAERSGQPPSIIPLGHLRFTTGLVDVTGLSKRSEDSVKRMRAAQALARRAQYQGAAVPRFAPGPQRPEFEKEPICTFDRRRPAESWVWVRSDANPADDEREDFDDVQREGKGSQKRAASKSVAARRHYGRWARQNIVQQEIEEGGATPAHMRSCDSLRDLRFCDSLQDLVHDPPDGVPMSLRNKIALFYADGNSFTKLREEMGEGLEGQRQFSKDLKIKMRTELLAPLVNDLAGDAHSTRRNEVSAPEDEESKGGLRFELLLWGGDEVTFVVPAWLGWRIAETFFECVKDWSIRTQAGERRLTFGAGLVFCNAKTPVRRLRRFARDELADAAKASAKARPDPADPLVLRPPFDWGALEVEVLESFDVPLGGIADLRRRSIGLDLADTQQKHWLTIPGAGVSDWLRQMRLLKDKFPRSQLSRAVSAAQRNGNKLLNNPAATVQSLEDYFRRAGVLSGLKLDDLEMPVVDATREERIALGVYHVIQHWDYIGPFEEKGTNDSTATEQAA